MNVSAWAIRRPVPAILLFVLLTAVGMLGFNRMGIQNMPDISFPAVIISAGLEGAAPAQLARMLQTMLRDLANTPLPAGFCLGDIVVRRRLHELEFHLPAPELWPERLRAALRAHGYAAPPYRFEVLQGHLKGFIDLVFEHAGRWYVLDWKSNHLGDTAAHYGDASVQAAMDLHDYSLQAMLYQLALHRFLARRLSGYAPERHLGGALYLFVRGVRPGWVQPGGSPSGVWHRRPSRAALDDLAAALGVDAPGHSGVLA